MKSTPEPLTQEVLAGLVERVTFHNAENGFCVLRAKARFGMISNPRRRGGS
jgi:exodeoxyribonuclease V alpha subunit